MRCSIGIVVGVGTALIWLLSWPIPTAAAPASVAADGPERAALAETGSPTGAVAAVARVRARSGLASTLPESQLDARLASLLQWMVRDYASSPLRLLSALPEGRNAGGRSGAHLSALQKTYWLEDNSLYGAAALNQYAPVLGKLLSDRWHGAWQQSFPRFCPDTQSSYVIARIPDYDRAGGAQDPRCRLPRPDAWQFFPEHQYPNPADPRFDTLPRPIIGTDYPEDGEGRTRLAPITSNSPRDLLKYGCLRQVLTGNRTLAEQMFDLALADWDGSGFVGRKNSPRDHGRLAGIYWTRDLAFALLCANALGQGRQQVWGEGHSVAKAAIEQRLWGAQSQTGGIWTNYCGDRAENDRLCAPGQRIPQVAKQTNELAPLVLLAYGLDIWASPQ
jgi:hypothetical protein